MKMHDRERKVERISNIEKRSTFFYKRSTLG